MIKSIHLNFEIIWEKLMSQMQKRCSEQNLISFSYKKSPEGGGLGRGCSRYRAEMNNGITFHSKLDICLSEDNCSSLNPSGE